MSLHNISYQKCYAAVRRASLFVNLLFLSACATTHSRIQDHQGEFHSYPPEVQMKLQNGDIDKDFTETMVYIAKGAPNEKTTQNRGGKIISIWRYGVRKPREVRNGAPNSSDSLSGSFGYPEFGPHAPHHPAPHQEAPSFEVEFENGHVTQWH